MPTSEFLEVDQLADELEKALADNPRRCADLAKRIGDVDGSPATVSRRLVLMGPRALCGVAQQWLSTPFIYDDGNLVADHYRVDADNRIVLDRPDVAAPGP